LARGQLPACRAPLEPGGASRAGRGDVPLDAARTAKGGRSRKASGSPRDADRESAGPGQLYGGASSSRRGSWRRHVVVPGSGRGRTGEEA
jgi:hypothetical protein